MKKALIEHLELFWTRQLKILITRRPAWILSISFVVTIFAALHILISVGTRYQLGILPATANTYTNNGICLWGIYIFSSVGLFVWMSVVEKEWRNVPEKLGQMAWLYSAFDIVSMTFVSLIVLDTIFYILVVAKITPSFLEGVKNIILLLYMLFTMLSCILTILRLLSQQSSKAKAGLSLEMRLAIAIPVFLTAFGVLGNSFLPEPAESEVMILAGLLLVVAFVLVPVFSSGIVYVIALKVYKIYREFPGDMQFSDEQQIWLQEISRWLDPGEEIIEFTVGYMKKGWSRLDAVLVLTDKYIRIGSTKGGINIPWQDVQKVEWSEFHSQIRVFAGISKNTITLLVFGHTWKEHAKRLEEAWKNQTRALTT